MNPLLEHLILKTMGKLYKAPKNVPKWVSYTLIATSKFFRLIKILLTWVNNFNENFGLKYILKKRILTSIIDFLGLNFQVLDKVPFFKNKEAYVIPMENPDLNPFAVEEVYEAPSKTVSYKTM